MRIRWTRNARAHLYEIAEYVARDRPLAAARLVARLRETVSKLERNPLSGRVVPEFGDPAIRERLVSPYRILYHATPKSVCILGIYHSRRLLPSDPAQL